MLFSSLKSRVSAPEHSKWFAAANDPKQNDNDGDY
jgi:hypothetical protein